MLLPEPTVSAAHACRIGIAVDGEVRAQPAGPVEPSDADELQLPTAWPCDEEWQRLFTAATGPACGTTKINHAGRPAGRGGSEVGAVIATS